MNWTCSYQDVLAATLAWAREEGAVESVVAPEAIARRLGVSRYGQQGDASGRVVTVEKFDGQVARALNALAGDGSLVKVGRGQPGPGDGSTSNYARYWTPLKYAEAEAEELERQAQKQARAVRWAAVHDGLVALGIEPAVGYGYQPGRPVHIALNDWELLLAAVSEARQ